MSPAWRTASPYRLVVFTLALIAAASAVDRLLPIVVTLLLTIGFGLALDVPVRALGRLRVPRPAATAAVVLAVVAGAVGAVLGLLPAVRGQLSELGRDHGSILVSLVDRINALAGRAGLPVHMQADQVAGWLSKINVGGVALSAGEAVLLLTFSLMGAAWAVAAPRPLRARLLAFVPARRRELVLAVTGAALDRLRRWLFGSSMLSLAMGLLTYVALLVLGVPFALLFAVIAAVCELVPTVGVLIASAGPVLMTLLTHPGRLPVLLIGIVVIHQVEDRLLQPLVMRRAVDIPPTIIGFAVLLFGALLGVLGALIALPVTAIAITVHDVLTGADPAALEPGPAEPEPEPAGD